MDLCPDDLDEQSHWLICTGHLYEGKMYMSCIKPHRFWGYLLLMHKLAHPARTGSTSQIPIIIRSSLMKGKGCLPIHEHKGVSESPSIKKKSPTMQLQRSGNFHFISQVMAKYFLLECKCDPLQLLIRQSHRLSLPAVFLSSSVVLILCFCTMLWSTVTFRYGQLFTPFQLSMEKKLMGIIFLIKKNFHKLYLNIFLLATAYCQ